MSKIRAIERKVRCSCGNKLYTKGFDELSDGHPAWKCTNCHKETKRIVRISKETRKIMNMIDNM